MAAVVALSEKVLSAKSIICDIEGTTTSISFVKDILFPYALKNVEEYLKNNWNEDATKTVVAALREQAEEDKKAEVEGVTTIPAGDSEDIIPEIVKNVEWQMSQDRKTGSLKTLQGLVWAKGYKDGTIKGHVYDDVQKAFEQWTESGRKIYIYSSGSVDAQKLLFENSEQGDLLKYLAGHYDTKIGAKREKESYESILKNIESSAEETLFLTDVYAEAKAAKDAGLNVVLLDRPGNVKLSDEERKEFTVISTFSDLSFEAAKKENGDAIANGGKRKIEDTIEEANQEEDQAQEPPSKVTKVEADKAKELGGNGTTEDKGTVADESSPATESGEVKSTEKMEVDGGDNITKSSVSKDEKAEKMEEDPAVDGEALESVKQNTENTEKIEVTEKKKAEVEKEDKVVEKEETTVKEEEKSVKPDKLNEKEVESMTVDEKDGEKKDEKEVKLTAETEKDAEVKQAEITNSATEKKVDSTSEAVVSEPVEEKKDEDKVKENFDKENNSKTEEVTTSDVPPKTDVPAEEKVATVEEKGETVEDKTDQKDSAVVSTTDKEQAPKSSNEGETEEAKVVEENGTVTEAKATTNGGSSAGDEEKNGSDSDKENDTSATNCEAEEVAANGEKTNGNATESATTTTAEDVTSTEIKAKKVIEPVTAAVTPAPPIEAES
uniref:Enolase-phosphatase E1 n=1 Tax=Anopheles minimus TaxID=112268 RepID=A0A182VXR1_9DIPT